MFPDTTSLRATEVSGNGRHDPVVEVKAIFGKTFIGNEQSRQPSPQTQRFVMRTRKETEDTESKE